VSSHACRCTGGVGHDVDTMFVEAKKNESAGMRCRGEAQSGRYGGERLSTGSGLAERSIRAHNLLE